jgi:hypothetical protein
MIRKNRPPAEGAQAEVSKPAKISPFRQEAGGAAIA